MLGDWFWNLLFNTYSYLADYLKSVPIIQWTDDAGVSHTISFFAVLVTYLIVQAVINLILMFNEIGVFDPNDDD